MIFVFAIRSINFRKPNTEEDTLSFVILATMDGLAIDIIKTNLAIQAETIWKLLTI